MARPRQICSFIRLFIHKSIRSALTIPGSMLRIYQTEDLITRWSRYASKKIANRFFKNTMIRTTIEMSNILQEPREALLTQARGQ